MEERVPQVDKLATFEDLGLSELTLQALAKMGFEHPTPIQEKAIPVGKKGRDVIGQARTGTGKTCSFGVPFLERYDPKKMHVQGLVLAPTRELAVQIKEEIDAMSSTRDLRTVSVYGGVGYEGQQKAFDEGAQIVIGTPGRIMDHMKQGNVDLSQCKYVVLDEADRMLDMGFIDDMEWILKRLPGKHERQTMLFSATMPEEIKGLARRFLKSPQTIRVSADELTVPDIDQVFYPVGRRNKHWALTRLLDSAGDGLDLMIVFCATKSMCDRLVHDLQRWNYKAEPLHGDMPQAKREKVLKEFDAGRVKILVATDVAARGLDIDDVTHVVNWDLPDKEPEMYVHRIGRTGRAGRKGIAVNFVGLDDKPILKRIEMLIGKEIREAEPPALPKGVQEKINRKIDWDELADRYGDVHVRMGAGSDMGLNSWKLHQLVQKSTGLPDHAIRDLRITPNEATFAVPKDMAQRAKNGVERTFSQARKKVTVEFLDKETSVRTA